MDLSSIVDIASNAMSAVGVSALLAAVLPRPSTGSVLSGVFKVLDLLAGNWLSARNHSQS